MTATQTPTPFTLTLEQRQKLGHVYLQILGWQQEREHKKSRKDASRSQEAFPHSQPDQDTQACSTEGQA